VLTHIRTDGKWALGGGRLSHVERGRVKPSVAVLATRRPQMPPALHPVELLGTEALAVPTAALPEHPSAAAMMTLSSRAGDCQ